MLFQSQDAPLLSNKCGYNDDVARQRYGQLRMLLMCVCDRDSTAVPVLAGEVDLFPVIDPSRSFLASPRGPFLEQIGWMR